MNCPHSSEYTYQNGMMIVCRDGPFMGKLCVAKYRKDELCEKIREEQMPEPAYQKNVFEVFRTLQHAIHKNAQDHGWWDVPREDGTCISLMHSELSECVEALRMGNPLDKHLPEYGNAVVELADVVIRIMDYCEMKGWNLGKALVAKHEFNKTRPFKHGGKEF
jgi:NTP pyrophosphatase (non-canonical NTP hydrolase)